MTLDSVKPTSFRLDRELLRRLKKRCNDLEIEQTTAVDQGIRMWLDANGEEVSQPVTIPQKDEQTVMVEVPREFRELVEGLVRVLRAEATNKAFREMQSGLKLSISGVVRLLEGVTGRKTGEK